MGSNNSSTEPCSPYVLNCVKLCMKIIMRDLQCDRTSALFPRPCNIIYQQKRTDSPLLPFTIHLDSQADCDDSTQLNVSFSGCSKETRFPIPNYIRIVANNSSMILSELWQTGADSTQLNSFMRLICKMLQIHPVCTFA